MKRYNINFAEYRGYYYLVKSEFKIRFHDGNQIETTKPDDAVYILKCVKNLICHVCGIHNSYLPSKKLFCVID